MVTADEAGDEDLQDASTELEGNPPTPPAAKSEATRTAKMPPPEASSASEDPAHNPPPAQPAPGTVRDDLSSPAADPTSSGRLPSPARNTPCGSAASAPRGRLSPRPSRTPRRPGGRERRSAASKRKVIERSSDPKARPRRFEQIAELREPAGLKRYQDFLQGLLDAGETEMEGIRRRFLCLHGA